jgi:hypothetical protein
MNPLQKPVRERVRGVGSKRKGGDKPLPYNDYHRGGVYPHLIFP